MCSRSNRSSISSAVNESEVTKVLEVLGALYPHPVTALDHDTPWQLLVATILSAQCTDRRVNMITPRIFSRYPLPEDLRTVPLEQLEELIKDCGLFHSKARNLLRTAELICTNYGGEVPADREALMSLPGVGRKTANVVLSSCFGFDAIAVDTHVFRLAHRLGWSRAKDVRLTEEDLMEILPQAYWTKTHHWLIFHGRSVCTARNPQCGQCPLLPWCEQCGVEQAKEEGVQ